MQWMVQINDKSEILSQIFLAPSALDSILCKNREFPLNSILYHSLYTNITFMLIGFVVRPAPSHSELDRLAIVYY